MARDILQLEGIKDLPLWAQVLIASRMARRAAYGLPGEVPEQTRRVLVAGCDAVDRCAQAGEWLEAEKPAIVTARDHQPVLAAEPAVRAFYHAADATHAAHDSLDFSAAESACVNSSHNAVACASQAQGLSPIQVRIFAASDLDQLRFACTEAGMGRYDPLGSQVIGRLAPVHAPDPVARPNPAATDAANEN